MRRNTEKRKWFRHTCSNELLKILKEFESSELQIVLLLHDGFDIVKQRHLEQFI